MTDNNKYDITDMIVSAAEQKPLNFELAFNDIIVNKIHDAIEQKKIEVAQQFYGYETEQDYESEE